MFCPVRPCSFGLFGLGFVPFGLAALARSTWPFFRSTLQLSLVCRGFELSQCRRHATSGLSAGEPCPCFAGKLFRSGG